MVAGGLHFGSTARNDQFRSIACDRGVDDNPRNLTVWTTIMTDHSLQNKTPNLAFYWLLAATGLLVGCVGNQQQVASTQQVSQPLPLKQARRTTRGDAVELAGNTPVQTTASAEHQRKTAQPTAQVADRPLPRASQESPALADQPLQFDLDPNIQPVNHQRTAESTEGTLTIDGKTFRVRLLEDFEEPVSQVAGDQSLEPIESIEPVQLTPPHGAEIVQRGSALTDPLPANVLQLNLPTALSMIGGRHPAVGFAQWRVRAAYAELQRAKVMWLPTIQPGFSFHRHDGHYQASDGSIVDVDRNSFQAGLGTGATGAGTTPNPGVLASFHLADAIFQPKIAQRTAWARGHAANGVLNRQLLDVAVAYLQLLDAEQDLRIVQDAQQRTSDLWKLTDDFAAAGQGLQADADRMKTELQLVNVRMATARERADVASAQLAQQLSVDATQRIVPLDPTMVPLDLVSVEMEKGALIAAGLASRPELKEAQALVAAACEQYRRQKYAPFVPSVLLGFSTGGFGGGLKNELDNIDDRYDFDANLTWQVRNLGLGEGAARRQSHAVLEQAKWQKVGVMDQVAREVSEAHAQVVHRAGRIAIAESAISTAQDSYQRNLSRIRDAQGLPLEVLQSIRALEEARRAYLQAVVQYNEAQFRLQWALGWPVAAAG